VSGFLARLRDPKLWLGLATLAVVLALVLHESERTSPGPLTSAHAAQPELEGGDGCERCHSSAGDAPTAFADMCSTCHEAIGEQLRARSGFHGRLDEVDPGRCALCHIEHHGDEARLVDARAFALAGVADVAQFEHRFVEFALAGAHEALECAKCHRNADAARLGKGETRFLGLSQGCASCHADPHDGKFDANCASCHGQVSFTNLDSFRHTEQFPLLGRHAGLSCEQCHAKDGPHAVETVGAVAYSAPPRACQDCHASPHAPSFVANVAANLQVAPRVSCGECHSDRDGSFGEGGARMRPELHAASGFELVGGHARAECASCHSASPAADVAGPQRFRAKHPGARAQDCASCHASPHGAQFDAPRKSACGECHTVESWTPSRVDVAAHVSFELTGAHAKTACNDCHLEAAPASRVYRGAPRACESCHADAHEQAFAWRLSLVASEVRAAGGSCAQCHTTGRFDDVATESFDHAHWTGFELLGAHAQAACEACHARRATPDEFGRTFGRVASVSGAPTTHCVNCHRDAHRGAFDSLAATDVAGGRCAQCHGVDAFRPALASFDHTLTGFALDGAHARASCGACHGPPRGPPTPERSLGFVSEHVRGPATSCSSCHADAHQWPRRTEGATLASDCGGCHTSTGFEDVDRRAFDHAKWAGFPLEGAHGATACEACHVPRVAADELGRRFGRAAGTDCSACHVDVHAGQFARAGATDCASCHDPARPLREIRFDHQRDARFALDENHRKLDCSACHKPWPTADGRSVVRYKPLGVECADCHGVSGRRGG
jgi:hypothetical protein